MPEPDLSISHPHQHKEAGTFGAGFICPVLLCLSYDTVDCAQEMATSDSWPNMDSTNIPNFLSDQFQAFIMESWFLFIFLGQKF